MAQNTVAMPVAYKKNMNLHSNAYGKYYLTALRPATLDLQGLLNRVAFDQSVYSPDIVRGCIARITKVMVELLTSGQAVDWDGFGKFSVKTTAPIFDGLTPAQARQLLDYQRTLDSSSKHLREIIGGVHVRYTPTDKKYQELTSRKFKDLCTFDVKGVLVPTTYGEGDDAETKLQVQTLEEWKANNQPQPEP